MSIRAFHLFFVALSVVLAAFVGAWATAQYRLEHDTVYLLTATGAIAAGGALAVYGAAFQRKTRAL